MIINNIEFARKALEFHDTIAVSQFSRLRDALASDKGVLNWHLLGNVSAGGKMGLQLQIQGSLELICQRCLEPFEFNLDIRSGFIVVMNESDIPSEDEDSGDEDYLLADTQMQVNELIEDEVLLALPLAPKHNNADCDASEKGDALKKPNPFAVLQRLKVGSKD